VTYFHGGTPGLFSGEFVLPPATTGTSRCLADLPMDAPAGRRDRVYVTTGRDVARVYAAFYPDGALYEVEPDDELESDPDCTVPGVSYQCPTARDGRVVCACGREATA
jgi:hypothetical protein